MHYQVLPCAHKEYDQSYFSSQADYKQMQNYITHARSLYKRENTGVSEGRPILKYIWTARTRRNSCFCATQNH